MIFRNSFKYCLLAIAGLLASCFKTEPPVSIAVATNFYTTALELERAFEACSEVDISVTSGSTGQLYAQIRSGAPHDIFLAADQARPRKLMSDGLADEQFTYAIGRLVLWHKSHEAPKLEDLTKSNYKYLAMANPSLAPYGVAAQETFEGFGLSEKIVMGQNIGQAFSLVETDNAEYGFVSLSQVTAMGQDLEGAFRLIPHSRHSPIIQDAVMLQRGVKTAGAKDFFEFLKSETARDIIKTAGYNLPDGT